MKIKRSIVSMTLAFIVALSCATAIAAQATTFTYQGRLSDSAAAANGTYDLQFALYDAPTGGNLVSTAQNQSAVSVLNAVFTVQLDFGSPAFPGADRYLEIRVKKPADTSYTTLDPRQKITSAPYAIRSLNAANVETTTAGNSVVNSINNAATNTTINSDRLAADVVRLKPAASQSSTTTDGDVALLDVTGAVTDGSNDPPGTVRFRLTHRGAFGIFKNAADLLDPIIKLNADGGLLVGGTYNSDIAGMGVPAEGSGTRMVWYPGKAAFRAGGINGTQWDAANIGLYSTAFGENVRALGDNSLAVGKNSVASNTGTVALGEGNIATGVNSVALGYFASTSTSSGAPRTGSFVFSDRSLTTGDSFHAEVTNAAHWRVANGFRIFTSSNLSTGVTFQSGAATSNWCNQANAVISTSSTCAYLSTGGVWTNASSRDLKTNFARVNTREVLRKVLSLPIQTWNYKSDAASIRHIGAIAQDFKQTFNFGDTDKAIGTVDADGVALAAIQGLNEEMNERTMKLQKENERLREQIAVQNNRLTAQAAQLSEFETRLKQLENARPRRVINRRKK